MTSKFSYFILVFFLALVIFSCGGDSDNNTPPPVTSANIIGSVNLFDDAVTEIDNSNMTIKLEGSSFSTVTDASGEFTLANIPFGTYTLVYEKTGYGTFKKFDIEHKNTGNSTIIRDTPSLGQISTTEITKIEAVTNGSDVVVSITTNPSASNGNTRYIRYFLSISPNVSNEDYIYHSQDLVVQISPYDVTLSLNELENAGFSTGETVYVKAYGDAFWSNAYLDPNFSKTVFPNLNMTSANAVSFVVP